MVTSRHDKDESSTPSSGGPDPITAAIASLGDLGVTAPMSTRSATARTSTLAPPPASTRSASSLPRGGVGVPKGHLTGKQPLLRYGPSRDGSLCCGFIGGAKGSRLRFCAKELTEDAKHCGDSKHSKKFAITPEAYYVRMDNDSALCRPLLKLADLQRTKELSLVSTQLSSKDWVEVIKGFHERHNIDVLPIHSSESVIGGDSQLDIDDDISRLGDGSTTGEVFNFFSPKSTLESSGAQETLAGASSTKSVDSGGSLVSTWTSMKPKSYLSELPAFPEEKLAPFLDEAIQSIGAIQLTLERMLARLPKAFDAVETSVEEKLILGDAFAARALDPVKDLEASLVMLKEQIGVGRSKLSLADQEPWEDHGSFADYVYSLQEDLIRVSTTVEMANLETVPEKFMELAVKMADGLKAVAVHATQQVAALESKLRDSSRLLNSDVANRVHFGDIFDTGNLSVDTAPQGNVSSSPGNHVLGRVDGVEITLSGLIARLDAQEAENSKLRKELAQFKSSSKGVKFEHFGYESLDEIIQLLQDEEVKLDSFSTHVDACSIFCHYADGESQTESNTNELKAMRSAGITDPTCCGYVASFRQNIPPYLLGKSGSTVQVGSRFPIFKDRESWEGKPVITGHRYLLKRAVKDAHATTKEYIVCNLPTGSVLRELAEACNTATLNFWQSLITYLDEEILNLSKYGIAEDKVYTLISDELQLIFRQMFERRMKMQVFSANRDPVVYYARCIWTTLQAHEVMSEFADLGFGTHVLISSLFTRFLAEQTCANHGAGLAEQVTKLESDVKKAKNEVNTKVNAINTRLDKYDTRIKSLESSNKSG